MGDVEARALETDTVVMVHYNPQLRMKAKHFVDIEHAQRLWSERGDAEHRVDGIILQDVNAPYCVGTASDHSCLKWKEHSSIDLQLDADGRLHAADGPVPPKLEGRSISLLPSRVAAAVGAVVEYHVAVTDDRVNLMAIRTRPDKRHANGLRVVAATVRDVVHSIRPEHLASVSAGGGAA